MPTLETDDPALSLPLALQKLFYKVCQAICGHSDKGSYAAVAV